MSKLLLSTYSLLRTFSTDNINKITSPTSCKNKKRKSFIFIEDNTNIPNYNLENLNIIQDLDLLLEWRSNILHKLDRLQDDIKNLVKNIKVVEKNPPIDDTIEDFTKLLSCAEEYKKLFVEQIIWLKNGYFLYLKQDLNKKNYKLIKKCFQLIKDKMSDYKAKFITLIEIYVKIERMWETNNYRCKLYKTLLNELRFFSEKVTPKWHILHCMSNIFNTFDKLQVDTVSKELQVDTASKELQVDTVSKELQVDTASKN